MRVTLADDHQIIRVGLRAILEPEADIEIVGEATSAQAALELISQAKPDVAILDVNLPDASGLSIVPALAEAAPNTRVLVLTMHTEPQVIRGALAAGVHGFLNKGAEPEEVVRAVRAVAQGRAFVSVPLTASGLSDLVGPDEPSGLLSLRPSEAPRDRGRPLSEREREVLQLVARGLTQRQIAEQLGLRVKTVETYRSRLGDRFGARSRAELVQCARELGLLDD